MERDRAAQIFIEAAPGGGQSFGTGYLVTPNHVLTALHTVLPENSQLPARCLCQVRLVGDLLQGSKGWREGVLVWPTPQEWDPDGRLDLALIAIEPNESSERFARPTIMWGAPDDETLKCEALGFPKGRIFLKHNRELWAVRGKADPNNGSLEGIYFVSLDSYHGDDASARQFRDADDWKGFSGAALFAGGCLIGVVARALEQEQTLKAIRIDRALRSPSFKELLKIPDTTSVFGRKSPDHSPRELDRLVCMLDRQLQDRVLLPPLMSTLHLARRPAIVCLVEGARNHAHDEIAYRLGRQTLPTMAPRSTGSWAVRPLAWPTKIDSVERQLDGLKVGLQSLLSFTLDEMMALDAATGADDSVDLWRRRLDHPQAPAVFYSALQATHFDLKHGELLLRWTQFLDTICAPGLEHPRIHVLALIWDDPKPVKKKDSANVAALKRWLDTMPKTPGSLVQVLRLPELEPCEWMDLSYWFDETVERHRPDLARCRDRLERALSARIGGQREFALADLKSGIQELRLEG